MEKTIKNIWIIQIAEALEIDEGARIMRSGLLSRQFEEKGFNVIFFSASFDHMKKKFRKFTNKQVHVRETFQVFLLRSTPYMRNLSVARVLSQFVTAIDFFIQAWKLPRPCMIVISYPSPELAATAALYSKLLNIPYVVDIRDAWPTIFKSYGAGLKKIFMRALSIFYGIIYHFILYNAKALYGVSASMLIDAQQYSKKKLQEKVYFLGYPEPPVKCHKSTGPFSKEHLMIVSFVGTFGSSYNVELLIKVAKNLHNLGNSSIYFQLIGDGEFKQEWQNQAIGLPNVEFCGWLSQEQIARKLNASHVGAALYKKGTDAFSVPNKLGEYLAFGLVILSSLQGDVPELLNSFDVGITIPVNDQVDYVTNWLLELSFNPSRLGEYQKSASILYLERFESNNVYSAMVEDIVVQISDS